MLEIYKFFFLRKINEQKKNFFFMNRKLRFKILVEWIVK